MIIIEGAAQSASEEHYTPEQAADMARSLISGGMSLSEAAKQAAKATGLKKGDIYKLLVSGDSE